MYYSLSVSSCITAPLPIDLSALFSHSYLPFAPVVTPQAVWCPFIIIIVYSEHNLCPFIISSLFHLHLYYWTYWYNPWRLYCVVAMGSIVMVVVIQKYSVVYYICGIFS